MSLRVAILFSGGGSNMVALARSMTGDHPARPCLALSNVAGAGGIDKADALDIPTQCVSHRDYPSREAFEAALLAALKDHAPDILCLAGFMRILNADFVSQYEGRMLNIHPSLLPLYKGLDTHARAIAAGDAEAGCTVHEVTAALDDGPILGQGRVPILPGDTPDALAARVLPLEHRLYPDVLRRFARGDRTRVDLA